MSGLRVAVIGGGIGGCVAALALQRAGCIVDVYEQVPVKGEVGAGIQILPNASRLLNAYGLAQQLEAIGVRPSMTEARRWDEFTAPICLASSAARSHRIACTWGGDVSAWCSTTIASK